MDELGNQCLYYGYFHSALEVNHMKDTALLDLYSWFLSILFFIALTHVIMA